MKYIVAIIQRSKFDAVQQALLKQGITGITLTELYERGRLPERTEIYRGAELVIRSTPMLKMELAVHDEKLQGALNSIILETKTGQVSDGSIYVGNIDETVRIRTGERGDIAL